MRSPRPAHSRRTISVEAIIPIHDASRPIRRVVGSLLAEEEVLRGAGVDLRVSVVCHNLELSGVQEALGALMNRETLTTTTFNDGIPSPAGPKNYALERSSADYVTFVDSDDYLERHAVPVWVSLARMLQADVVLAPIRTPDGTILTTPHIRPSKPKMLDPLRDGLASRSLPFGLLRRALLADIGFSFTEGLRVGEDLEPTLRLLHSAQKIVYPYGSAAYRQTDDVAERRVTAGVLPLDQEFAWVRPLINQDWIRSETLPRRRAIALKLLRVQGIGGLRRRSRLAAEMMNEGTTVERSSSIWDANASTTWRHFLESMFDLADRDLGALSRRDAKFAHDARGAESAADLIRAAAVYGASGRGGELVPQSWTSVLSHDSVLCHYINTKRRWLAGVYVHPTSEVR